jgi:hypothetical protein
MYTYIILYKLAATVAHRLAMVKTGVLHGHGVVDLVDRHLHDKRPKS